MVRSGAVFSPDGTQLAWWAIDWEGEPFNSTYSNRRIVIYDLESATQRILVTQDDAPFIGQTSLDSLYEFAFESLHWGDVLAYAFIRGDTRAIVTIDPETGAVITHALPAGRFDNIVRHNDETWYAAVHAADGEHRLVNLQTGDAFSSDQPPAYRLRAATEATPALVTQNESNVFTLTQFGDDVTTFPDFFSHVARNGVFALHPNGDGVAYYGRLTPNDDTSILIWGSTGDIHRLPVPQALDNLPDLAWGAMQYVLPQSATLTPLGDD